MSGAKKVERDTYLFREGDAPDAMYVVKSGKLVVVKTKQNSEITLAELGPGSMVGEMAFFDNKPRSASVRAVKDSEVIALPYKALHSQFTQFPEWTKAIMRTVNDHLRNANQRIKQLEKSDAETEMFSPHTITKLITILNFVGLKYGKMESDGLVVPGGTLRNFTIQVFQEATHKMQKLMNALMDLKILKVEDLGEGRQRVVNYKPDLLFSFVEWYNEWLFKKEADRVVIKEEEMKVLNGVTHFAKKITPNEKGVITLNLTEVQNESMKELGYLLKMDDFTSLIEKKVLSEKTMDNGAVFTTFIPDEIDKMTPYWSIIFYLKKITR